MSVVSTPSGMRNIDPTIEIGSATTGIVPWSSFYETAEEVPELAWPQSVYVYNKMRNDEQIAALLLSFMLPIFGYRWYVDPNGARDEVVQHVASDFGLPIKGEDVQSQGRRRDRFSFGDYLYHSLLKLPYGFMFFEQVYRYGEKDAKLHIRKLAPRLPGSIMQVQTAPDGGLLYIRQYAPGYSMDPNINSSIRGIDAGPYAAMQMPLIPVDRLIAHVNEKEGGNWFGRPWLRSIYRNWLLKDRLLRVDAMKHERNGMGVPTIEAPVGATEAQMTKFAQLAQQYKSGEASGGALPPGAKLTLNGVSGSLPDTLGSIRYHDEQMSRRFLAMFTMLGTCVDDKTEILTRRGWITHDQLTTADETLGMAKEDGLARWQPILDVKRFDQVGRQMVHIKSKSHDSLTTPNHRWLVEREKPRAQTGMDRRFVTNETMEFYDRIPSATPVANLPIEPKYSDAFVKLVGWYVTEGSLQRQAITLTQSASANPAYCATIDGFLTEIYGAPRFQKLLDEAHCDELLSELRDLVVAAKNVAGRWLRNASNESYWRRGQIAVLLSDAGFTQAEMATGVSVSRATVSLWADFYRCHPDGVPSIRFTEWCHSAVRSGQTTGHRLTPGEPQWRRSERFRENRLRGATGQLSHEVTWHLNQSASEPVLRAAIGPEKVLSNEFITALTEAQLRLLLTALVDGDGWEHGNGHSIVQANKARIDAFQMVATLAGYRTNVSERSSDSIGHGKSNWTMNIHSGRAFTPKRSAFRESSTTITRESYTGVIWCPVTPDQTWLARRNGTVFYTGNTATGSRALGNTFVDFFGQAQQSVAKSFADTTNEHVVEDLIDLNYGIDEGVPLIKFRPESDRTMATADLVALITAGAITVDADLEDYLRAEFDMPEREGDLGDDTTATTDSQGSSGDPAARQREKIRASARPKAADQRKKTDTEKQSKADYPAIKQAFNDSLTQLVTDWGLQVRQPQIAELMALVAASAYDDYETLASLSATPRGADLLVSSSQALASLAADMATQEIKDQGVELAAPDLTNVNQLLAERANAVETVMSRWLSQSAATAALADAGGALSSAEIATNVGDHLNSLSDAYLSDQLGGALMAAQNQARMATFDQVDNKELYASELADSPTCCESCREVDGTKYDTMDDARKDYPAGAYKNCRGGPRCRGTVVATVSTESTPSVE